MTVLSIRLIQSIAQFLILSNLLYFLTKLADNVPG